MKIPNIPHLILMLQKIFVQFSPANPFKNIFNKIASTLDCSKFLLARNPEKDISEREKYGFWIY
jgi:hypothetical protein